MQHLLRFCCCCGGGCFTSDLLHSQCSSRTASHRIALHCIASSALSFGIVAFISASYSPFAFFPSPPPLSWPIPSLELSLGAAPFRRPLSPPLVATFHLILVHFNCLLSRVLRCFGIFSPAQRCFH
uniref:RH05583p n=1 Tax=Drosophila melanogaster TaxID=7227 RepID=Q8IGJ5_DROME|nr:RH05583p [Drosophila melanogaster]